jgi:hypothetical protein
MSTPVQSKQQSTYNSNALPGSVITQLQNAKDLAVNRLLRPNSFSNIVGIGLGRKVVGAEVTDTRCVRIYVQSKYDLDALNPSDVVPQSFLDIPTDVIEVGRLGRAGNRSAPRDDQKLPDTGPGSSIRLKTTSPNVNQGAAGTLGAVVGDGQLRYILSCNHVLNVNGRVNGRVQVEPDTSTYVVTPALSANPVQIALPGKFFVELIPGQQNTVDCGIAPLLDGQSTLVRANLRAAPAGNSRRADDPAAPGSAIGDADRGQRVKKDGAVTGLTSGTVVDVNADFYVQYSFGTFLFTNQVVIEGDDDGFAADGDSGSIVIESEKHQALAMIFAESGRFAVACPLTEVFRQLRIKASAPGLSLLQY